MLLSIFLAIFSHSWLVLIESKPVVILHVGPMKTGTSYIQQILASKTDELAERKIRYLTPENDHAHHFLQFPRNKESIKLFEEIESSTFDFVIASSESLSNLNIPEIEYLKFKLQKFTTKIVAFSRDYYRTVTSEFSQHSRHLNTSIQQFLGMPHRSRIELYADDVLKSDPMWFDQFIDKWISVFSERSVFIVDYGSTVEKMDIVNGLLEAVSAPVLEKLNINYKSGEEKWSPKTILHFEIYRMFLKYISKFPNCSVISVLFRQNAIRKIEQLDREYHFPYRNVHNGIRSLCVAKERDRFRKFNRTYVNGNLTKALERITAAEDIITLNEERLDQLQWKSYFDDIFDANLQQECSGEA